MYTRVMFFSDRQGLLRVFIVTILAYALLLRVSGKRTLSKMNAFDLVMTVALPHLMAPPATALDWVCGVPEHGLVARATTRHARHACHTIA